MPIGPSKSNFHLAADPALSRVRAQMEALVRNSIRLWPEPSSDDDIPIGASKLGGMPDLPPDLEWPQFHIDRTPYSARSLPDDGVISLPFIGQFNFQELTQYDGDRVLPKTGMLYVFFFHIVYVQSEDWMHDWMYLPEKIRVFHTTVDKELLTRRQIPANLPGDRFDRTKVEVYTACKLQFTQEKMLPPGEDFWGLEELMTAEEYHHWVHINYHFRLEYGDVHHMLGYPDLGSHGPEVPHKLFPPGRLSAEEWVARGQDHRLLLQLDNIMWDIMGFKMGRTVYFCMRNQDLLKDDFSRVWIDIE